VLFRSMNLDKYPYAKKFLEEHPSMNLDQALVFVENELAREVKHDDKHRVYSSS
jgi:hypothetical protein